MFLRMLAFTLALSHAALLHAEGSPNHFSHSGYSFNGIEDWENIGAEGRPSLMSPDGTAVLSELVLKDQPKTETLVEANERVNFFNRRVPEDLRGIPKKVSGKGWEGLLQSQTTRSGGHEFQLVAKAGAKTLVFYIGSPPGVAEERLEQLEQILLSLSPSQK